LEVLNILDRIPERVSHRFQSVKKRQWTFIFHFTYPI
jgi:phage terminase Nu1 subunit (DNA packaging protein)